MKKYLFVIFSIIAGFCLFPCQSNAFNHGYKNTTDYIYALARNDLPVYYYNSGDDFKTYLPAFSGLVVTGSSGSWYEIQYEDKSGTQTGWVTKDEFTYDCLIYDGREKQILANGIYRVSYHEQTDYENTILDSTGLPLSSSDHSFTCKFIFQGNDLFTIQRNDTGKYLLPDQLFDSEDSIALWGNAGQAGSFRLIRKGNYYGIQDADTNRYLGKNEAGLLSYTPYKNIFWRFNRTKKAITQPNLRVFVQFDPDWAADHYGKGDNPDPSTNNFCTSGCGIFATMNAIYSLTGHYVNPHILADYAVEKYYRIEGHGTDSGFFKAAAGKFGYKYGFEYDGSGESLQQLKDKLKKGDTAIVYVPGHYTAIVDYNKKTKKFLLLDPHYLPKRGTSSFGDWVSEKDLEEGNLMAQMFFYYKRISD